MFADYSRARMCSHNAVIDPRVSELCRVCNAPEFHQIFSSSEHFKYFKVRIIFHSSLVPPPPTLGVNEIPLSFSRSLGKKFSSIYQKPSFADEEQKEGKAKFSISLSLSLSLAPELKGKLFLERWRRKV
jgi:hypothetical protein